MDCSPCKNIYIDFHGKLRRYSGLLETTVRTGSKRQKIDEDTIAKKLSSELNLAFVKNTKKHKTTKVSPKIKYRNINEGTTEKELGTDLNLAFVKNTKAKVSPKIKYTKLIQKFQNDLEIDKQDSVLGPSHSEERSRKIKNRLQEIKMKHDNYKHDKEVLNDAFIKEKKEVLEDKLKTRTKRHLRLSGIFKRDLNTGFVEEDSINNNCFSLEDSEPHCGTNSENEYHYLETLKEIDNPGCKENHDINNKVTLTLRTRPTKQSKSSPTEEEIIQYYTDKSLKTKQNILETIFETPKPKIMSVRKYKRFINFNERMSCVKVKKRLNRIIKFNLWENKEPVTMDYFTKKMEDVERDL